VNSRPVRAHAAREETMRAFLEQLDARYGGLPDWLSGAGFTEAEVAALHDRLRKA
jgi:protein-tyrosine phosphatase